MRDSKQWMPFSFNLLISRSRLESDLSRWLGFRLCVFKIERMALLTVCVSPPQLFPESQHDLVDQNQSHDKRNNAADDRHYGRTDKR